MAKVLVTSDCATSDTQVVPAIVVSDTGAITVTLGATAEEGGSMPFLAPSAYAARWTWDGGCSFFVPGNTPGPAPGPAPDCDDGQCRAADGTCAAAPRCDDDPCAAAACAPGELCLTDRDRCAGCRATCVPGADGAGPAVGAGPVSGTVVGPLAACAAGDAGAGVAGACGAGRFCRSIGGACEDPAGECVAVPAACGEDYAPACGCDGRTYWNECQAAAASVGVARRGACDTPVGIEGPTAPTAVVATECRAGPAGADDGACGEGRFCRLDAGACDGRADVAGRCARRQAVCTMQYDPVCGCDGRTYSNDCGAGSSGVNVARMGECRAEPVEAPVEDVGSQENTAPPSCEVGARCNAAGDTCTEGSETCCGETHASLECTCELVEGSLRFGCLSRDACMRPSCCRAGAPAGTPPPAAGTCEAVGQPCDTGIDGDYCCHGGAGGAETFCSKSGGTPVAPVTSAIAAAAAVETTTTSATTSGTPIAPVLSTSAAATAVETTTMSATTSGTPIAPVTSTTAATTSVETTTASATTSGTPIAPLTSTTAAATSVETTTMSATTSGVSIAAVTSTTAATTSVETTTILATSSIETTTTSDTAVTAGENVTVDADFPAAATAPPALQTQNSGRQPEDPDGEGGDFTASTALHHSRSFLFCLATTGLAIVVMSVLTPGSGGHNHLWGFGTFAVAALAASSLRSKTPPNSVPKAFPAQRERALPTCSYNVEILIDGCTRPLKIFAPSGRVVDVVIEDLERQVREDDPCVTDYEATLTFPITDPIPTGMIGGMGTTVLDLSVDGTVDRIEAFQCQRAVIGRPFVDATGGSLHAMPWVPANGAESAVTALSWAGEALMEEVFPMSNATARARFVYGEDWIHRALGEHASIASFSAFSIALMSNGAPAGLVADALKAGLDEVRHSRTSFDIAARLTGQNEAPGPLPESSFEFGQDLKSLALAVAKEGCVDETLSAFSAAFEVKHMTDVLDERVQDTLYSSIGNALLTFIKDELIVIAMDESNHAALAWRTLDWVCSVDQTVCEAVYTYVFEETNLEMSFKQHAGRVPGDISWVLRSMREEWNKIFEAHRLANSAPEGGAAPLESICRDDGADHDGEGQPSFTLLASVTENVLRQVLCTS